ncbi:4'-phosphopantetheinyl transferase superfamily protein [Candidatus Bathycorpusculum sp.]|uniref:4'-phosphopantetheinyl transferase family protein n=1 Tax=Candidatus Bathycorpusculum sp. TaxID=2994959 RepID=UPI00282E5F92|nr:4'-phosphopantetheinyl transferase superfamily protein [Candidatus Termitimicrobium sp.]
MFEVVILRVIPELTQDEYDVLLSFVSLEKQERIKRFYFFRDRRNSLMGDVLARAEICRIMGFSNSQLEFAVNRYGKPFLVNNSQVHYNISHAGQYVACVVGDMPVGIDIEVVRSIDVKIAERFFVSEEKAYVLSSQGDRRNERFFEVWTKKESRIKWEGRGLESLSCFSVLDSLKPQGVFYHCIYNNGEIIGHVCSSSAELPSVRVIDTRMLLQCVSFFK